MTKNSLTLSLPEWIDDFLKQYQFPLVSNEERMRFVLKLTLQNIEKTTGGPFGAAVFERESGQLVSVGVNVVLKQGCSAAHAEMMAIMLAQQELGTHDLGIPELPEFQLVTSGKMCAMCLGSVVWSGVREVLASAQPEDVENIVGFDEGPVFMGGENARKNTSVEMLKKLTAKRLSLRDSTIFSFKLVYLCLINNYSVVSPN